MEGLKDGMKANRGGMKSNMDDIEAKMKGNI